MAGDEGSGRQIEDQTAIHLGIEGEVEVIDGFLRIAKAGLLSPTFQQAVAATGEFVRDQAGDQVDGRHGFDLSLVQTHLEYGCDSASRSCRKARFNSMRFIHLAPWFWFG